MTFDEAKINLKDGYLKAGVELVTEEGNELLLKYRNDTFVISEEEITEYAESQSLVVTLETKPAECSVCGPTFREQIVRAVDPIRARFFMFPGGDREYVFGELGSESPYVKLASASMVFV